MFEPYFPCIYLTNPSHLILLDYYSMMGKHSLMLFCFIGLNFLSDTRDFSSCFNFYEMDISGGKKNSRKVMFEFKVRPSFRKFPSACYCIGFWSHLFRMWNSGKKLHTNYISWN